MKANDGFTTNPNVIWMLPPKPVEEDVSESIPCKNPNACIESGELVYFRGEDEFSLKIGGTTYDISTHFSTKGKESVLEQFKRLILSEKLI